VTDEDVVTVVVGLGSAPVVDVVDAPVHPARSRTHSTGRTRTGDRMAL
jgi:hypothetical protein